MRSIYFVLFAALAVSLLTRMDTSAQLVQNYLTSVNVKYTPAPSEYLAVNEGQPLTIPMGKTFVVTAAGARGNLWGSTFTVSSDGLTLLEARMPSDGHPSYNGQGYTSVHPVPEGIVSRGGATLSITTPSGGDLGVIYGYLSDH